MSDVGSKRVKKDCANLVDNTVGSVRYVARDNRSCKLCFAKDMSEDPIIMEERIWWAYPPADGKKPEGHYCMYCLRVYERRYAVLHRTIEIFVAMCGSDASVYEEFKQWRVTLIEHIKSHDNNRSARMQWSRVAASRERLESSQKIQCVMEEPEDKVYLEEDYIKKHGNPDHNGLGHNRVQIPAQGGFKRGVCVPGEQVWRIKRSRICQASVRKVHADTADVAGVLGADNLEANFKNFELSIFGMRASGAVMSFGSILGQTAGGAGAASSSGADPASNPIAGARVGPALSSGAELPGAGAVGFGFFGMTTLPREQNETPNDSPNGKAKPKSKSKRMLGTPSPLKPNGQAGFSGKPIPVVDASSIGMQGDGAGAGGLKRRGAPLRDLVLITNQKVEEWMKLQEDSDYWNELKAHRRNITRLSTDLDQRMATFTKDSVEWLSHKLAMKKVHVLLNVIAAFARSGAYSKCLVKAIDEGAQFLEMDPVVLDFGQPVFFKRQAHEMHSLSTHGRAFWEMLAPKVLADTGYVDVDGAHVDYISQKIVATGDGSRDLDHAHTCLLALLDTSARDGIELGSAVAEAVACCETIVCFKTMMGRVQLEVLYEAIETSKDVANKIPHALRESSSGAQVVALALKHYTEGFQRQEQVGKMTAILDEVHGLFATDKGGEQDAVRIISSLPQAMVRLVVEIKDCRKTNLSRLLTLPRDKATYIHIRR